MSEGQFEHRAQTNEAILIGVCTRAGSLKILKATDGSGEAMAVAELTMRIDNGDDSTFVTVEAYGPLAFQAQQMVRRGTYQLTGRMIVSDRKKQAFNQETQEWVDVLDEAGKATYFQNFKLRLMDRRVKFDGTPNPDAPAPIVAVKAETRHQCAVLFYGTIGKKGVELSPTGNGRVRARFTAANNGGSPSKPQVSWMPVVAYGNEARQIVGVGTGSLVKVASKLNVYKNGKNQTRVEFIAAQITVIALKSAATPSQTVEQNANADALEMLQALGASNEGEQFQGAIDDGDHTHGEIEGEQVTTPEQLAGDEVAGRRRTRAKAGAQTDAVAA